MRKRLFILMLTILMLLSLAACKKSEETAESSPQTTNPPSPANNAAVTPTEAPTMPKSDMAIDGWPAAWKNMNDTATMQQFNQAIADKNSAYLPQDDFTWSNGAITLAIYPAYDNFIHSFGIMASYTDGRSGEVKWGREEPYLWLNEESGDMTTFLARWLWNVMAEADTATTIAELEALTPKVDDFLTNKLTWPTGAANNQPSEQSNTPNTGNLPPSSSKIKVGEYPEILGPWITFGDFYDAVKATGSKYYFVGPRGEGSREDAVNTLFGLDGSGSLIWSNGTISIGVFVRSTPAADIGYTLDAVVIEAWETMKLGGERVICWSTDDAFSSVDNPNGIYHTFAWKLWDCLAYAEQATTMEEMLAIREVLAE